MNTDEFDQYIIVRDHPSAPGLFSLRRINAARPSGFHVAAHKNIEAIRVAIPTTHKKASAPVEAPIVEVWIDRSIPEG